MADIDWSALYESMTADIESGQWMTKSYQIGSRRREFRDLKEILDYLAYVETKAAFLNGTVKGRTYARPVRRH